MTVELTFENFREDERRAEGNVEREWEGAVCVCVYVCVCVCVSMRVYVYVLRVNTCMSMCVAVCLCVATYWNVSCDCVCMCVCVFMYVYVYVLRVCMYVCVFVCGDILKRKVTTWFTRWNNHPADVWEVAEILKSQLASIFTIRNGCRADFWEVVDILKSQLTTTLTIRVFSHARSALHLCKHSRFSYSISRTTWSPDFNLFLIQVARTFSKVSSLLHSPFTSSSHTHLQLFLCCINALYQ